MRRRRNDDRSIARRDRAMSALRTMYYANPDRLTSFVETHGLLGWRKWSGFGERTDVGLFQIHSPFPHLAESRGTDSGTVETSTVRDMARNGRPFRRRNRPLIGGRTDPETGRVYIDYTGYTNVETPASEQARDA